MSTQRTIPNPANLPKPIAGPGLTTAGVVILQSFLIIVMEFGEYHFSKVGTLTGIAIVISLLGSLYLGRDGTEWISIVNPPIVFAIFSLILIVLKNGVHISKFTVNFVSVFSGVSFYLVGATAIGWAWYFLKKRA
jgi:hypothetical protein